MLGIQDMLEKDKMFFFLKDLTPEQEPSYKGRECKSYPLP